MKKMSTVVAVALLLSFFEPPRILAQENAPEPGPQSASAKSGETESAESEPSGSTPKEQSSVTQHTARINGQTVSYIATASTTLLKNDKGEPEALMYSTAYTKEEIKGSSTRPITFLYNGGPGSASVWLHMGAWGPRRIVTGNAAPTPGPPYQIVDNDYTLLDESDLVFIDPVGTGFSRAVGKAQDKDFWSVEADVESLAQFIYIYLSRHNRWNSPKLLYGESYGTFRSVALANYLQKHDGIYINGIVLQSSVLDLGTLNFTMGEDYSYILYLPTYAAIAWHYNLVNDRPADLATFVDQVRQFAGTEYAHALLKGSRISEADKTEVAARMAAYTGLDVKYILKADLRVTRPQFRAELLRSRGLTIGYYDGRFSSPTYDLLEEDAESAPSFSAVVGAFTAAFNHYVREELRFGEDMTYAVLPAAPAKQWKWEAATHTGQGWPAAPNAAPDLVKGLLDNAYLQVQVENGYFDLSTPFFATEYTMNHLLVPKEAYDRIHFEYYDAGHMIYLHIPSLAKLSANVRLFITQVSTH